MSAAGPLFQPGMVRSASAQTFMLHAVKHDLRGTRLWCGPAALSAVTGLPTSVIRDAVQTVRRDRRPVQGMNRQLLVLTLTHLGFGAELFWSDSWQPEFRKPTLVQFHKSFRHHLDRSPILINVTGHFVALQGDLFVDSWFKEPVAFCPPPVRRRRVEAAWKIFRQVLDVTPPQVSMSEEHRAYQRAAMARWRARHPERNRELQRARDLKRGYGISVAQYDKMLLLQGGVCAICKGRNKSKRRLSVDHNHASGEIRGLLCDNCNSGLGRFRDSPEFLRAAAEYLLTSRKGGVK